MASRGRHVDKPICMNLRVDGPLYRALERIAKTNERSVPGEIRWLIKKHVDKYDKGDSNDHDNLTP